MRLRFSIVVGIAISVGIVGIALGSEAFQGWAIPGQNDSTSDGYKVLLEKESLYHYIRVVEFGGVRYLQFRRSGGEYEESAVNIHKPLEFEMYYYSLMFAGFAHKPDPKRILFIGLGGGTVPMAIHYYYPGVPIDNIELDPDVVEAAKKYFGFKEDDDMKVYVRDGRVQARRLLRDKIKYDVIFVDAFRGGYIPYHLTTKEFMEILRSLLTSEGIVVSNLRPGFESYHYHRRTFDAVFKNQYAYGSGGNVAIIVDMRDKLFTTEDLLATARKLQKDKQFTFNLPAVIESEESPDDYKRKGPILTDDYAPTDVLRGIPRD